MKKFEVRGTEYEMGLKIGKVFRSYLQHEIKIYDNKIMNPNVLSSVKSMENKLRTEFPKYLDEIYGRADGAKVSRDSILLMFFPEIYNGTDGCTTLMLKKENGTFLFSHNEDEKNYTSENIGLIKYIYDDYWIIGYTLAKRLTGSAFSYNSYGLVFSSNYIYDSKIDLENISRYIMVRDIISSKNIDDVIEKMKNHKVASAFSMNILDTNLNRAVNIEKDIDEFYIKEIDNRYARSNHFILKDKDLPEKPVSSNFRYNKTNELINKLDNKSSTIEDLINILKYESDEYFETVFKNPDKYKDKSITCANFSYDNESKMIYIKDYLSKSEIKLKYNEF